ncbi:tail fiber protein [Pelomonas sp. P7]|uniref:Tail fiber protein n=1 Tax=Pelomonas caseinilytica TaxID=2906763 RepID=A0ABS8XD44_9BURK|nr:tail fiber protein [Pelomonas sp. P7]MCE4537160.1 tail fiber protein [Pelomonas sp. P7]
MSEPFLGELKLAAFGFAPRGWAFCNGQLLPIAQNQALFSLLGTNYGGDGRLTFGLPDLRGRTPMHADSAISLGERAGHETVTLGVAELPPHTHTLNGTSDLANAAPPGGALPAAKPRGGLTRYAPPGSNTVMFPGSVAMAGGSQSHDNMQPFLVMTWLIALQGIFPSRN